MKVSYFFKKKKYLKNSLLFEEDNLLNKMYLLIKGEIQLYKKLKIPSYNKAQVSNHNQILNKKLITIKNNKLFGIWEIYNNINSYHYSGKVFSENVTVFEIDKEKILQLINNKRFEEYLILQSERFNEIHGLNKKNIHQYFLNVKTKYKFFRKNFNQQKKFLLKMDKNLFLQQIKKINISSPKNESKKIILNSFNKENLLESESLKEEKFTLTTKNSINRKQRITRNKSINLEILGISDKKILLKRNSKRCISLRNNLISKTSIEINNLTNRKFINKNNLIPKNK